MPLLHGRSMGETAPSGGPGTTRIAMLRVRQRLTSDLGCPVQDGRVGRIGHLEDGCVRAAGYGREGGVRIAACIIFFAIFAG